MKKLIYMVAARLKGRISFFFKVEFFCFRFHFYDICYFCVMCDCQDSIQKQKPKRKRNECDGVATEVETVAVVEEYMLNLTNCPWHVVYTFSAGCKFCVRLL